MAGAHKIEAETLLGGRGGYRCKTCHRGLAVQRGGRGAPYRHVGNETYDLRGQRDYKERET